MTHRPIDPTPPREPDSYRGYRAEYPTPGQAWCAVAGIVLFAAICIGALLGWAFN